MCVVNAKGHAMITGPYTIDDLASISGLTVRTIRYYRNRRLVPKHFGSNPRYATYGDQHLRALMVIRKFRDEQFTLADLHERSGFPA